MKVRAIIVDDEAPARELIATLARDETDFEVVSQCASGREHGDEEHRRDEA